MTTPAPLRALLDGAVTLWRYGLVDFTTDTRVRDGMREYVALPRSAFDALAAALRETRGEPVALKVVYRKGDSSVWLSFPRSNQTFRLAIENTPEDDRTPAARAAWYAKMLREAVANAAALRVEKREAESKDALLRELAAAWRGDWSNFDGRVLRDQIDSILSGKATREYLSLCKYGGGHWDEYCPTYGCGKDDAPAAATGDGGGK